MKEEGIENPTDEEVRRFDKSRKKTVSNQEWESATDPDSRIARMKDGRTHLAYKAENVIDLDTEFIIAAEIHQADQGDTKTVGASLEQADENLQDVADNKTIEEVAADKGYHSEAVLDELQAQGYRTYIPERKQANSRKTRKKQRAKKKAVLDNRRRMKGKRGKGLQKLRSERVERSFAHLCETGGSRRTWLRSIEKVKKRYLLAAAARNLGLIMRQLFGIGTARGLQGLGGLLWLLYLHIFALVSPQIAVRRDKCPYGVNRHINPGHVEAQSGAHWSAKIVLLQRAANLTAC